MLVKEEYRLDLYFGSTLSAVNILLFAVISIFIALQYHGRGRTSGWGSRLLILVSAGLLLCMIAAIRDGYFLSVTAASGGEGGLFSVDSFQSTLASAGGGLIAIAAGASIFIRNDRYRMNVFFMVSGIFVFKLLLIEASRIMMGVG